MLKNKTRFILLLMVLLISVLSCKKNNSNSQQLQIKKYEKLLKEFFSTPVKTNSLQGVWRADQKKMQALMEKKFFSNYKSKPNESSLSVLRNRLKSLHTFLAVKEGGRAMLLSFPLQGPPGPQFAKIVGKMPDFKMMIKGKNKMLTTQLHWEKDKNKLEKIIYKEKIGNMIFFRVTKNADVLVPYYLKRIDGLLNQEGY